eukprot:jgi/Orpsp1_1/1191430/evm.model.d7180000085769.2
MKFIYYSSISSLFFIKHIAAKCSRLYGQCGGLNYGGEECCESNYECIKFNEWYSQCLPSSTSTTTNVPNEENKEDNNSLKNDYLENDHSNDEKINKLVCAGAYAQCGGYILIIIFIKNLISI